MPDLSSRSQQKELLDAENIPFTDIRQNMKELNVVNTMLGGHKITINGIKQLTDRDISSPLHICEIGCGGGDNLAAVEKWSRKNKSPFRYTGIDLKPECIDFARQQYPDLECNWICSDYRKADLMPDKPSIIFSSLFCHHFNDEELVSMMKWMKENSTKGFFINDLQRHPFAYHAIKWITKIFSRSYLVKNDAPLSVARALSRKEWVCILDRAGIRSYRIQWKWAFRFLIVHRA